MVEGQKEWRKEEARNDWVAVIIKSGQPIRSLIGASLLLKSLQIEAEEM